MKLKRVFRIEWKYVILTILTLVFMFVMMNGTVLAAGITSNGDSSALYDRYPFMHYSLDWYVDNTGGWLPWNWGDTLSNGIYSIFFIILNIIWLGFGFLFYLIGKMVEQVYNFDLVDQLGDVVQTFIQSLAGVNSSGVTRSGLFSSGIVLAVVFLGGYLIWKMLKRETGEAMNTLGMFVAVLVVSIGFFMNAGSYIKLANQTTEELQNVMLAPVQALTGGEYDSVGQSVRDQLFRMTVYEPYLILQFNETSVSPEKADMFLSLESGSEAREALVEIEVENGNKLISSADGLSNRAINLFALIPVNLSATIVVFLFAAICLWHQLCFIMYTLVSPFVLLVSLLPGRSRTAVDWVGKTVYELVMKVLVTMLLTLMFMLSTTVYNLVGASDYLLASVLICIIQWGVFLYRNKIIDIILSRTKQAGMGLKGALLAGLAAYRMMNGSNTAPADDGEEYQSYTTSSDNAADFDEDLEGGFDAPRIANTGILLEDNSSDDLENTYLEEGTVNQDNDNESDTDVNMNESNENDIESPDNDLADRQNNDSNSSSDTDNLETRNETNNSNQKNEDLGNLEDNEDFAELSDRDISDLEDDRTYSDEDFEYLNDTDQGYEDADFYPDYTSRENDGSENVTDTDNLEKDNQADTLGRKNEDLEELEGNDSSIELSDRDADSFETKMDDLIETGHSENLVTNTGEDYGSVSESIEADQRELSESIDLDQSNFDKGDTIDFENEAEDMRYMEGGDTSFQGAAKELNETMHDTYVAANDDDLEE